VVRRQTPADVYESYHDIAKRHLRNELTVSQFRGHLESLFKKYKEVLDFLPTFFSDHELPVSPPSLAKGSIKAPEKKIAGKGKVESKQTLLGQKRSGTEHAIDNQSLPNNEAAAKSNVNHAATTASLQQ
jgi:hypothetical protein